ncbi:D-alanyl-D-alanine carboxypeptidase family protein [Pannonibacter carbonis]|uniref:D-alanyl-D-alanine carboxypeptidase family protein n=1 Tax=Pannonibacter carbonis TaxID=2067569 RepID=UPI001FCC7407|nr:D-alanyl-D-alanine carboxypeptidase family protein [Pannonibacter carbonis]
MPVLTAQTLARPLLVLLLAGGLAACQSSGASQRAVPAPGNQVASAAAVAAPVVAGAAVAQPPASAEARAKSVLVLDGSGREIDGFNADAPRYPASLTKMMTLYLLFEAIDRGELTMMSEIPVSARAASRPPARIGVPAGSTIRVEDAVQALAVRSANDMAVAVAEAVAGSESVFAARMTAKAQALGMSRTRFVNASGLSDTRQVTTARDMARLAAALSSRYPQYLHYFNRTSFAYDGRVFEATNKLIGRVPGVNGLKTGYLSMSGYNLVATAERGGRRVMVVVMGGATEAARDREVTDLIERYYADGV